MEHLCSALVFYTRIFFKILHNFFRIHLFTPNYYLGIVAKRHIIYDPHNGHHNVDLTSSHFRAAVEEYDLEQPISNSFIHLTFPGLVSTMFLTRCFVYFIDQDRFRLITGDVIFNEREGFNIEVLLAIWSLMHVAYSFWFLPSKFGHLVIFAPFGVGSVVPSKELGLSKSDGRKVATLIRVVVGGYLLISALVLSLALIVTCYKYILLRNNLTDFERICLIW